MSLREAWDAEASNWARFTRTPGHDHHYEGFHLPRFLEVLPAPGRVTLDLGCGEGRLGRLLQERGHRVVGIDSSEAMVRLARSRHPAVVADAARLPLADSTFDLVVAYMSLHDMDDMHGAVREASRVLARGGRLCMATMHPLQLAGEFDGPHVDSPFTIRGSYLEPRCAGYRSVRGGVPLTFNFVHRPLRDYGSALEDAELVIESLREPRPPERFLDRPSHERLTRVPELLLLRALKP